MSLHAQISPEAQAALAAQRRNSTVAAIIVGFLMMTLLALIFWLIGIKIFSKKTEPIVAYSSDELSEEVVEKVKVTNAVKKTPASPSSSASPVIASSSPSAFAVPVPEIFVDSPNPEFGESDGFGDGFGDGSGNGFGGGGGAFSALPSSMKKRCSPAERLARLKETGGNEKCEEAVVKSLDWIKATQKADGSWTDNQPVAMTGFSILCYLGHCETPLSPEYGESVEKAIIYLINVSKAKGGLLQTNAQAHWGYEHAIATYALAEAYTFCKIIKYDIEGLQEAVSNAASVLISGQSTKDSWDYKLNASSGRVDNSLGCWCLQALKACKATGLKLPGLATVGMEGIERLKLCTGASGGVGYSGPNAGGHGYTLTGAGLLCMQQWGEGKSPEARRAGKWLNENTPFEWAGVSSNLYSHYYNGQAFMEMGGQPWEDYNERFRDEVLGGQAADGSYTNPGGKMHSRGNYAVHYRTCLATLMLEVYYRFLPGTSKK